MVDEYLEEIADLKNKISKDIDIIKYMFTELEYFIENIQN